MFVKSFVLMICDKLLGYSFRERRNEGRENQYGPNPVARGRHVPTRSRPDHGGNLDRKIVEVVGRAHRGVKGSTEPASLSTGKLQSFIILFVFEMALT
ncbi:hypothetical protein TcasGA2_TC034870 [Tribolium castaneum]|uniref:Uncharacterized protein n=1 Tax=Tribolium castaneum TaxID=7070 RepID=A0A139WB74_TRICA|nr:hypothetical protein TcasGA2_TC034870 [Tribolium castaneum]